VSAVFDASAVLAILNDEPGAHRARSFLRGGIISTVNVVEVGTRLVDKGATPEVARAGLRFLKLKVVDFDVRLGELAVELRSLTRSIGLSLADRACLALATRERLPALTADRVWAELDLPCPVELIR
jgi:ribonuclease VapC